MIFVINSKKQKLAIDISIQVFSGKIVIVGYDPTVKNTEYFNLLIDGPINKKYTFNLPQSPNVLEIMVFEIEEGNKNKSSRFKINSIKVNNLQLKSLILDEKTSEFVAFMNEFAEKAAFLNPGIYYSNNNNFQINYLKQIADDKNTPSRVHIQSGIIDVSKAWFINMTIPGRKAILTHEFSHSNLDNELIDQNDNDEVEKDADNEGLKLYLALGNPKFEWMYAWTHIFQDHESHFERLDNSIGKLNEYN